MAAATNPGLRRSLAAVLIIALTLAGLGRAAAAVGMNTSVFAAGGVPICHSGADADRGDPARPARHDCCDDCALLAAAVLPAPPSLAEPARAARRAAPAQAAPRASVAARSRDQHLPRGPPAA